MRTFFSFFLLLFYKILLFYKYHVAAPLNNKATKFLHYIDSSEAEEMLMSKGMGFMWVELNHIDHGVL